MRTQHSTTPPQIGAAFPLEVAAAFGIRAGGAQVRRAARAISNGKAGKKRVHELRIACRRMEAAIDLFGPCVPEPAAERLKSLVDRVRKAGGRVRAWDVLSAAIKSAAKSGAIDPEKDAPPLEAVARSLRSDRISRLQKCVRRSKGALLDRAIELAVDECAPAAEGQRLFSDASIEAVRSRSSEILSMLTGGVHDIETLHQTRISLRQLRYLLEVAGPCVPEPLLDRITSGLASEQESFGALSDASNNLRLFERSILNEEAVPEPARERFGEWLGGQLRACHAAVLARLHAGHLVRLISEMHAWASEAGASAIQMPCNPSQNALALAPSREDRVAVIDVGTNSVRLLVGEVLSDGTYKVLDDEREGTRLGQGLVSTGALSAQAMLRTADTIARMRGIAQGYGVSRLRVIGTSAVRDATNQREFLSLVQSRVGVSVEVLSGEDEARAAHRSVADGFDLTETRAAVVDIGGGSTEIVLSANGVIEHVCSIRVGAVRLSEMYPPDGSDRSTKRMRRYVKQALARALPEIPFTPSLVVGTGGTFSALKAMNAAGKGQSADGEGGDLRRSEVRHMLDRLGSLSLRERMRVPGLQPERADIIVAGAAIVEGVLKHLGANALCVYHRGVRDGVLLAMAAERECANVPPVRTGTLAAVRAFAEQCRYERAHSEHVATLALRLLDQMKSERLLPPGVCTAECRMLLEAAAVLHDIGYLVNYAKHHKHSMRMILSSELRGFTPRQRSLVANIARYHRRGQPTTRHPAFKALRRDDRGIVASLAAILRVADGLDRGHAQTVTDVVLRVSDGVDAPKEMLICAIATERPTTELWGAERKAQLMEHEFGVRVCCQWETAIADHGRSLGNESEVAATELAGRKEEAQPRMSRSARRGAVEGAHERPYMRLS